MAMEIIVNSTLTNINNENKNILTKIIPRITSDLK